MVAKGGVMMNSIVSGGGPLVCLELEVAKLWLGVAGSKTALGPEGNFIADYDRACGVRDYLGCVPLADRAALILGDMPLETLVWRPKNEIPGLVRIYYADPGVDVIELLESTQDLGFDNPDEVLPVGFLSSSIVVFDSALSGVDSEIPRLIFDVPKGKYLALTKQLEPDDRTSVLIHRFFPAQ